ncbi:hypothetical protein PLICRDRAFT_49466 [Plicaturopsis crispa FD-325 SS-3]|nr:hypothetical protein PLICRDRAFT_49466 [Plicaturopsis crispa FD-325 SS-3]
MFYVKPTYHGRTHRFILPYDGLPTYEELLDVLAASPILGSVIKSNAFFLSAVEIGPGLNPSDVYPLAGEVHNAEDYAGVLKSYLDKRYPGMLLKFVLNDKETALDDSVCSKCNAAVITDNAPLTHGEAAPMTPPQNEAPPAVPTINISIDASGLISSSSADSPAVHDFRLALFRLLAFTSKVTAPTRPETPTNAEESSQVPSSQQSLQKPCCDVSTAKAEVQALITGFMASLETTLDKAFGTTGRNALHNGLPDVPHPLPPLVKTPQAPFGGDDNFRSAIHNTFRTSRSGHDTAERSQYPISQTFGDNKEGCYLPPGSSWALGDASEATGPGAPSGFAYVVDPPTSQWAPSSTIAGRATSNYELYPAPPSIRDRSAPERGHARSVVDADLSCNLCSLPLKSVCYACPRCPGFKVCYSCNNGGALKLHNMRRSTPHPKFEEISMRPSAVSQDGGDATRSFAGRNGHAMETADTDMHRAVCNMCRSEIQGDRYKCLSCPGFNTCSSCFYPRIHGAHSFVRVRHTEDIIRAPPPPLAGVVAPDLPRHLATSAIATPTSLAALPGATPYSTQPAGSTPISHGSKPDMQASPGPAVAIATAPHTAKQQMDINAQLEALRILVASLGASMTGEQQKPTPRNTPSALSGEARSAAGSSWSSASLGSTPSSCDFD